ncbi:MAG: methyltransferase domain-containing protein [Nanoarchaeota archaeon]|nr:methyltransferase domain-containing protein [Nanoarchaeota archaeon]
MNNTHEYLLIMQGSNYEFFYQEFKNLFEIYFQSETFTLKQIQNTLYSLQTSFKLPNKSHEFFTRITLTKGIYELLFQAKDFDSILEELHLRPHLYSQTFAVSQINIKTKANIENSTLAYPIGKQLHHLKANLKEPNHLFQYIFIPNKVYFTHTIFENQKTYLKRMPVKRAINKPYTLKADMGRTCINLLDVKSGDIVLDPFCGIGGILLEGIDMNLEMIGNDINKSDLEHTKTNCTHFNLKEPTLYNADSKTQFLEENSVDGIVSDIPYGKSSRKLGVELYEGFLQSAQKMLKPNKKMVIIYGCFTNFKPLALKYFEEITEIEQYMNSSLTRYILVLKNTKKK